MKFTLTITEASTADIARLMTLLGAPAIAPAIGSPFPPFAITAPAAAHDDDDTHNDNEVSPGALDEDGLPWDDRIHSTPASQTTKGVWRKKRGVADGLVKQVEAELRDRVAKQEDAAAAQPQPAPVQQYQQPPQPMEQFVVPASITGTGQPVTLEAPAPVQQYAPQPAPVQQYQQPPQPMQPVPVQQYAPQPAPVQQYQQPPQQVIATLPPQMDFGTFMQHIQAMLPSGIVDAPYLNSVASRLGVAAITSIAGNQQMIDNAVQIMVSEGRWR